MGRNIAVNLARHVDVMIFAYHSNRNEAESLPAASNGMKSSAFRLDSGTLSAFDGFVADVRKALKSWVME